MSPMNTPEKSRLICMEMADESVREYRNDSQDIEGKVDTIVSIVSLMLFEIPEAELREYLTLGGVDLTDYAQFTVAQEFVSWYVSAGTLEVTELFSFSLVDLDTTLVSRSLWDSEMQARMDKIKTDGIFFRDMMVPYVEE